MLIEQISIFVENKPGRLAEITEVLHKNAIDIRAMSIADTRDFGILRLIVNKPTLAEAALKEAGYTVSLTKVIAIGVADEPGGLASAMKVLFENGISVEYMYAFISQVKGTAYVIMRVEDNEKAMTALKAGGLTVLLDSDVYDM